MKAGRISLFWDGRDGRGRLVPAGRYRLRVLAQNAVGKAELFGDVIVRRPKEKTFVIESRS
jgi:hypothetical protein